MILRYSISIRNYLLRFIAGVESGEEVASCSRSPLAAVLGCVASCFLVWLLAAPLHDSF